MVKHKPEESTKSVDHVHDLHESVSEDGIKVIQSCRTCDFSEEKEK